VSFQQQKDFNVLNYSSEKDFSSHKRPDLAMVMTTDEAEKRYCPMKIGSYGYCEASGCMGWRWLPGQTDVNTARGYCGLAQASVRGPTG
jgi:hypothetical protein